MISALRRHVRMENGLLIKALSADCAEWAALADYAASVSWRAGPYLARRMRENRFAPWERVFAAYLAGEPVGFCTLTAKDELPEECAFSPFIGFVFVGEQHRGHRISQQLIAAACAYAKSLGYAHIYLTSDERGLYEKYGFIRHSTVITAHGEKTQLFTKGL